METMMSIVVDRRCRFRPYKTWDGQKGQDNGVKVYVPWPCAREFTSLDQLASLPLCLYSSPYTIAVSCYFTFVCCLGSLSLALWKALTFCLIVDFEVSRHHG